MSDRPSPLKRNSVKKVTTCVVDGNALLKNAYFGAKNLYNSKGVHIGGIYQFYTTLRKVIKENSVDKIIIFWDGKYSGRLRFDIYPEYKQNRNKIFYGDVTINEEDESFYYQKVRTKQYAEELFIKQFEDEIVEADDCIGYYISKYKNTENIIICSGDRDLLQLICESVSMYVLDKKIVVTDKNFYDIFGYPHQNVLLIKTLIGDDSDNIKGVKGIKEKTLFKLIPDIEEKLLELSDVIETAKFKLDQSKGKSKTLKNIVEGVTLGSQGENLYRINNILINLSTPLITDECREQLDILLESDIDPENRETKNLLRYMQEDEFFKEIPGNSEGYVEYLQPFLRLIKK